MAVLARSAGYPDYHRVFIPELWVPEMQLQFELASTFQDISTTKYEGEIKDYGDSVYISIEPTVTINDHTVGQKLIRETLAASTVLLEINKAKSFSIHVDDISQKQSQVDIISAFSKSAARRMKEKIDYTVLQGIYNSEATYNSGATAGYDTRGYNLGVSGTPKAVTSANILDTITDISSVLDERSVPAEGRWLVIPPAFQNLVLKSDLKDASFVGTGTSIALNGKIQKQICGFDIYISRQLYSASDGGHTCFYCLAGNRDSLAFASQLVNTRAIEANDTFGQYIDGLQVFGYKVVRSEGLAVFYGYKG